MCTVKVPESLKTLRCHSFNRFKRSHFGGLIGGFRILIKFCFPILIIITCITDNRSSWRQAWGYSFTGKGKMDKFSFATLRVKSFIPGYHVYKEDWEPESNEERELIREPNNQVDPNAVAVVWPLARPLKDCDLNQASCSSQSETNTNVLQTNEEVVGHIPLRMASCVTRFLKRRTNKGKVVVTRKRVNRGAC